MDERARGAIACALPMAELKTYSIRCPRCSVQVDAELYESLDVREDPSLRDALLGNRINQVTCPECSFVFRVDKDLVYHDPGRRLLICCAAAGNAEDNATLGALLALLPEDLREQGFHLVSNRTELIERIFLAEAGLDARIIEYIKYTIYSRNRERLDPAAKALLFNAQDSTDEHLCFVVQDVATRKLEAMLQYGRDAYTALQETFSGARESSGLMELFPGPRISARTLLLDELTAERQEPPADQA